MVVAVVVVVHGWYLLRHLSEALVKALGGSQLLTTGGHSSLLSSSQELSSQLGEDLFVVVLLYFAKLPGSICTSGRLSVPCSKYSVPARPDWTDVWSKEWSNEKLQAV